MEQETVAGERVWMVEITMDNAAHKVTFTSSVRHNAMSSAMTEVVFDPDDGLLSLYFDEISREPLLSAEEEVRLAQCIEQGQAAQQKLQTQTCAPQEKVELEQLCKQGQAVRKRFISTNMRLVVSVAKGYRHVGLPFLDIIQAGNIGLIKAVDHFDYRLGNRFSTYATWWIRQAITRALTQQGHTIRLPAHVRQQVRAYHKMAKKLEKRLERQPTLSEVAEALEIKNVYQLEQVLCLAGDLVSLNAPMTTDGDAGELQQFIVDKDMLSPSQQVQRQILREDVVRIMRETLKPRERTVVIKRFGLYGQPEQTYRELAKDLHISPERVRQIQRRAFRKLRLSLHQLNFDTG